MEVGHQRVDHMQRPAWIDKDIGVTTERLEHTIARSAFQRTHAGRTDGNHPTATRTTGGHGVDHILTDLKPLAVHVMIFDALNAHRLKSTRTDVEGHERLLNTLLGNCRE